MTTAKRLPSPAMEKALQRSDLTGYAETIRTTFLGNNAPDTDAIDYDGVINGIIQDCNLYNFKGFKILVPILLYCFHAFRSEYAKECPKIS